MSYNLNMALMCGSDIPIPECQIVIHQPRMFEIALIGDEDFLIGVQTLNINKNMINQGETLLANTSNFQIFMTIMREQEAADKKEAVKQVFTLLLPNYSVIFSPRGLILNGPDGVKNIDEQNFEPFQQVLEQVFCVNTGPMETRGFNPANDAAKKIAEKLMKARERVAAQKQDGKGSLFAQYISVITVGIPSMSLEDCKNLTMYQLLDLVERYMLYTNWDLDIRSRLAGAKADKPPENWMKNIH